MKRVIRIAIVVVVFPSFALAKDPPAADTNSTSSAFVSWYPKSIAPPKGTKYPCKLTALPKGLPGIPAEHVPFIDHTFSMILKSTHAKLVILESYRKGAGGKKPKATAVNRTFKTYKRKVEQYLTKLRDEKAPSPELQAFQKDVIKGIELQMIFFEKARDTVKSKPFPQGYNSMMNIPEGRQASKILIASWQKISKHYKGFKGHEKTKDSIFHHLCALDLF